MKTDRFWKTSKLIQIKKLPLPISEEIQPLTKYFRTFFSIILVSFHLK